MQGLTDKRTKGGRIRYARESNNLSQDELGAAISTIVGRRISKGNVSAWESGKIKDFAHDNLIAMEAITGFSMHWIIGGKGPERVEDRKGGAVSVIEKAAKLNVAGLEMSMRVAWQHVGGSDFTKAAKLAAKLYNVFHDAPELNEAGLLRIAQAID